MFKKYVNISTYPGWVDYHDDNDVRWRRQNSPSWHDFYKIDDDQLEYIGSLPKGLRNYSIEETHKQFLDVRKNAIEMERKLEDAKWR